MLGLLLNDRDKEEIIYLLKREMDEILFDLKDARIESIVKQSMEERYKTLFSLFKRVASQYDCMRYVLPSSKRSSGTGK
ncbi:hypothetical protein ACFFF5_17755 [Lederbergia wuyishanensis]|uniref:Uncharacterized protein n=1 Tax=Lederbergia wuyishanensis TaxID=1347903 RepID=A0ABU0DAS9_9BACI|nr:hypothetical protein [Lederbergia wuyishanensis]MCJ8009641.1 hypothetical protein [Lederbergia wuyishanensis]MDQ0345485.1 hypothetical protein [Lederbergia wuyishanensis]